MKRFAAVLAALVVSVVIFVVPTVASAGPPTPIGIAEAKQSAKKYVHSYCRDHNCRGSRIKNCEAKTTFRVDCEGLYGKGERDVCDFKITVQAVKNRQLHFNIYGVKCHNF